MSMFVNKKYRFMQHGTFGLSDFQTVLSYIIIMLMRCHGNNLESTLSKMETFLVALISAQVLASRQKLHKHGKDYRITVQFRGIP